MPIAEFMKVSPKQFEETCQNLFKTFNQTWYESIQLPKRATKGSAGYDFYCPMDLTIKKGEMVKIPTGIRVKMYEGYVLNIYPRSSMGFKYQMALANTTGIIDSDYFFADNEGHIICAIVNRGDKDFSIKQGERFVQGIFLAYYLAFEEEDFQLRTGGYGSSGKQATFKCAHGLMDKVFDSDSKDCRFDSYWARHFIC